MSAARPTYIDYTPASEKSVYFDAPIMHIFSSKRKDSVDDDAGFVAPSPKRDSRIRSTTSMNNVPHDNGEVVDDDDTRSASAAVPGHLPPPVFPEPTPASAAAHELDDPTSNAVTQEPQTHRRFGSMRSTDFATLSPTMGSTKKLHKRREGSVSTATATDPDSGYDSPSPRNRAPSLKNAEEMQPLPVVWANGAEPQHNLEQDGNQEYPQRSRSAMSHNSTGGDVRRSQSVRSYRTAGTTFRDQDSVRTTPSGRRTPARRRSMTGGSFANGAGTIGPAARPDEEETKLFRARSLNAESALSKKQKVKLGKAEIKEGKRMAKVIKLEAKAEKQALEQAVRELAELQKIQKYAVKEEAKTNTTYAQAMRVFHKEELAYLAARARFERAQADLQCHEDARDAARDHAREATEMLQEKNREIEWLRAQKHADDREREVKLRELAGKAV